MWTGKKSNVLVFLKLLDFGFLKIVFCPISNTHPLQYGTAFVVVLIWCVYCLIIFSLWYLEENNPLTEVTLIASWVTVSSLCTSGCRTSNLASVLPGSETANLGYFSMKRVWGRSVPLFLFHSPNILCTSYKQTGGLKSKATGFITSLEKRKSEGHCKCPRFLITKKWLIGC